VKTIAWNPGGFLPFIEALCGLKIQEAPHVIKDSPLITVFFFSLLHGCDSDVGDRDYTVTNILTHLILMTATRDFLA
jgi:hypothetical protein